MKVQQTYLARMVRAANVERKTDKACKEILKSRWVLACILQDIVPEYKNCTMEEIAEKYIEPEQIYGNVPVGLSNGNVLEAIEGMDKESDVIGETTVYYDVKFRALLPDRTPTRIYLYFDVEAQNAYRPGYPLEKRSVYYMSRMVSSQLKTVSQDTNYGALQKVYSIWICMGMDIPKKAVQTITKYSIQKEDVYGSVDVPEENYDLMCAYILRLGVGDTEKRAIGMLQTLFMDEHSVEERLRKLEDIYGICETKEFKEEVAKMCTFSQAIKEREMARGLEKGIEEGREVGIEEGREVGRKEGEYIALYNLVKDGILSIEIAALRVNLAPEEFMDKIRELGLEG